MIRAMLVLGITVGTMAYTLAFLAKTTPQMKKGIEILVMEQYGRK